MNAASRLGFRPAFWPSVITLLLLPALLGLGAWQVQRMQWKNDLIGRIEARAAQPAVVLPAQSIDLDTWEYRQVRVSGQFRHDLEMHLVAHNPAGKFGYQVVTPLALEAGGWVLVNRGWIPTDRKDPATRAEGSISGPVEITGVVRRSTRQGWFVPENQPAKNFWFFADARAMAAAAKIDAPEFLIEADASRNPGGLPMGGQTRLKFPNNHLLYAITWFGGAFSLAAIYLLWHRRYRRVDHASL